MARRSNYVFGQVPSCSYRRNRFDLSYSHKTTMNLGSWYPVYCQPVQPGDSFQTGTTFVSQCTSSFIRPLMDNLFVDMYFFFVPYRLIMDDWEKVVAGAEPTDYGSPVETSVPVLASGQTATAGTIADVLGLPPGVKLPNEISVLRFRALAQVFNDWLRNENTFQSVVIDKRSGGKNADNKLNNNEWSPSNYMGKLPPAAKFHDYFTSALRAPQKGPSITVPLGTTARVETVETSTEFSPEIPLRFSTVGGSSLSEGQVYNLGADPTGGEEWEYGLIGMPATIPGSTSSDGLYPTNLAVDLTNASAASINALRLAFQEQKYLEKLAIYGGRYQEYLKAMFGVTAGDSRVQMAELLGGKRMPMSVQQVAQTSQGTEKSPLAQLGAFSSSSGQCGYVKGFVEHGVVLGVACIRQFHTYQQGVERDWFRNSRFDFYNPLFANLGFQPIYKKELFAGTATAATADGTIFGYGEAWADLRYRPNFVSGQMRNSATTSQKEWALADWYENAPTLNEAFLRESNDTLVDRLTVSPKSQDPFVFDFYFKNIKEAVMPVFSMPGLIDHH